jgi:T4 RnlA family RNA ligase
MLHVQKYLKYNSLDDLKNNFDIKYIIKDDLVCLKYGIKSPKHHPIVIECRGIILSLPDYNIVCRPFDRFFNLYEGDDYKKFDWNSAIVMEKLDGSLIKVYHYNDKWYCGTSGTVDASGTVGFENDKTFKELFEEGIGGSVQDVFKYVPKENTYLFELTSPENRIVKRYNKTDVTLLAIRNTQTGKYELPSTVPWADFKFVKQYHLKGSFDKVIDFVESMDQFDEGCILYDYLNEVRIKVKNSAYVALHHLRGNEVTKKSITVLLLKGEMDEFLIYFPEDKDRINPYIDKYVKLLYDIMNAYEKYRDIEIQKDFALKVKDLPYSGILFQLRKGKTIDKIFNVDNVNMIMKLI